MVSTIMLIVKKNPRRSKKFLSPAHFLCVFMKAETPE